MNCSSNHSVQKDREKNNKKAKKKEVKIKEKR